jgi:hypothetical protein
LGSRRKKRDRFRQRERKVAIHHFADDPSDWAETQKAQEIKTIAKGATRNRSQFILSPREARAIRFMFARPFSTRQVIGVSGKPAALELHRQSASESPLADDSRSAER